MSGSRHIALPGCLNFRDVGGYPTRDGHELAWKRLYRGAAFSDPDPNAASGLVRELRLRRVIDLRTSGEVAERGGLGLPAPCERLHLPLFESIRPHWRHPSDQSPSAAAARYMEMLEDGTPTLIRIVDALGDIAEAPSLIHCAVGRDRTGIVTACLLDLLGVPDEVIAADYALSDSDKEGERAHAETMHLFLRGIREAHGSTRAMLLRGGGSEAAVKRFRAGLLPSADLAA